MSTLLADQSARRLAARAEHVHESRRAAGGGSTLEELVSGVWEDLAARAHAVCPVCGDEMRTSPGAGLPGACGGCGSELS